MKNKQYVIFRATVSAALLFVALSAFCQSQARRLPATQYVDRHCFCLMGDNYTEVNCHIEMFDDVDLQKTILPYIFAGEATSLNQAVERFVYSYGTPMKTLPYTHKNHTPVEAVTCTIEDYTGNFITFFIYKEHIPATIYMADAANERQFVSYDMMSKRVLKIEDVFDMKKCKNPEAMKAIRSKFVCGEQFADAFKSFNLFKFDGSFAITDGHYLTVVVPQTENTSSYNAIVDLNDVDDYLTKSMKQSHSSGKTVNAPAIKFQPQPQPQTTNEEKIYEVVEKQPGFNGNVNQWLSQNIRYPDIDEQLQIEGKCIVQFVVEKDGSISNVDIKRHLSPTIDREAARVVANMPRWNPGIMNGVPVRTRYTLPITFRLQSQQQELPTE